MPTRSNRRRLVGPADAGHDLRHAELAPEQRREQVALVVVDHADQHVGAPDILALEELEVGAVAVEHQRAREAGRQHFATGRVALHDAHFAVVRLLEPFGQLQADVAAANDRHLDSAAAAGRIDQALDLPHRLGRAHQDDLVAGLQLRVAARDEQRAAAFHRDDQRAAGQMQLAERNRDETRVRVQPVLEQPDQAAGK